MPDVNHSAATVLHDSKATALTVGTDTPSRADILVYNDAASGGLYRTTGTSGTGDVQKVGLNSDDIANFETTTELNARDTANRDRTNHTGTQAISTVTNLQTTLDTKLESSDIANFETTTQLNARDTANRDRANHTGTQLLATISDAGTAAALDVGTSANNVVQLDGSARLPAVDGSQLTGIDVGSTSIPVRNTVMSGPASWLAAGTGLQVVSQNGAAVATIAKGFNATSGAVNDLFEIANGETWDSLTASDTCYLYVEYSAPTVTAGHSILEPAYSITAPTSPATGQWWFNTSTYEGQSWNGSAWVAAPRLYVGEAITDGSSVTDVVQYAYNGKSQHSWTGANSTTQSSAHNLGTDLYTLRLVGVFNTATNNYVSGDPVDFSSAFATTSTSSQGVTPEPRRLAVDLHFGSGGWQLIRPVTFATATSPNWNELDLTLFVQRDF